MISWLVAPLIIGCGGTERGAGRGDADARGRTVDSGDPTAAPAEGLELGGGQTSDFGDGVDSPCEYVVELVSRDAARAEGWPVDADLALFRPLVTVDMQREVEGCARESAGTLRIESVLVGLYIARGTPRPELVGLVECEPMLSYGIDVTVHAEDGWVKGVFHATFASVDDELYGSAFEAAESIEGGLALSVDRGRPHLARANLALAFGRSVVRGELAVVVYYSDQREPLMGSGERLLWPSSSGTQCTNATPLEDGSVWLSLDAYGASPP